MILPDFILTSRQNQIWSESGIDSKKECRDRKHFNSYPYEVEYRYNSRGFRDAEWPNTITDLKNAIWCFGDSFTVGLGSPIGHTWVNILQNKLGIRCINVSMEGASNEWIARKINRVIEEINPQRIVVQWSYLHRTESKDTRLSDEDRRADFLDDISVDSQIKNFINLQGSIDNNLSKIIQSIIPHGLPIYTTGEYNKIINDIKGADWPKLTDITLDEFSTVDDSIKKELANFGVLSDVIDYLKNKHLIDTLVLVEQIDWARDGLHYDCLTAGKFVDSIIGRLKISSS